MSVFHEIKVMKQYDNEIERCHDSITYYSTIHEKVTKNLEKQECKNLLISKTNSMLVRIIKRTFIELVDWRPDLSTIYELFDSKFVKCINWNLIDPWLVSFYYDNLEMENPMIYDTRCIPIGTFNKPVFPLMNTDDLISKLKTIETSTILFNYLMFPFCKENNISMLEKFSYLIQSILRFSIICGSVDVLNWILLKIQDSHDVVNEYTYYCNNKDITFDVFKILTNYIYKINPDMSFYIHKCCDEFPERLVYLKSL
jgi:hypothetical protein